MSYILLKCLKIIIHIEKQGHSNLVPFLVFTIKTVNIF